MVLAGHHCLDLQVEKTSTETCSGLNAGSGSPPSRSVPSSPGHGVMNRTHTFGASLPLAHHLAAAA